MKGCRRFFLMLAALFLLMGCEKGRLPEHTSYTDSTAIVRERIQAILDSLEYKRAQSVLESLRKVPKLMSGVQQAVALERPEPSFYRLTVIEDGTAWPFQIMAYDTIFVHEFCTARAIQICVSSCNAWGECSDTVCSDVWEVQPDTQLIQLTATARTDYNWIVAPEGLARASDLASHISLNTSPPTPVRSISRWNAVGQTYSTYILDPIPLNDFDLFPGEPLRVDVPNSCIWRVIHYNPKVEKWRWKGSK